jgi:hypothetical protein
MQGSWAVPVGGPRGRLLQRAAVTTSRENEQASGAVQVPARGIQHGGWIGVRCWVF